MINTAFREVLIAQDRFERKRLTDAINLLNSLDTSSEIEHVRIIECEDSKRNTRELVIDFYDDSQARINITSNSVHAILKEYYLYVSTGEATGLFYEGPQKNE